MKEFLAFIKNPSIDFTQKRVVIDFSFLLLLNFSFLFLFKQILLLLDINVGFTGVYYKESITFYLSIVLISPVLEEFLFRSILKIKDRFTPFLFVFSLISYLSAIAFRLGYYSLCIGFFISLILFLLIKEKTIKSLAALLEKNKTLLVYTTSILFGLMHMNNYSLDLYLILLSPLIMFPKIISGFSLAFIRLKYGLLYAVLLHILYNSIPLFFFKLYSTL